MWLQRLTIDGIRNLADVEIELCPGINIFTGPNGAGKTSILEAVHCLATGVLFDRLVEPSILIVTLVWLSCSP